MNNIYIKTLSEYGINTQKWVLIEEMGEVMQAFSHEKRNRATKEKVINELIDLQTILNSVKLHYITDYEWNLKMKIAEDRLNKRIDDHRKL